jgi:hypothetical protein
MELMEGKLPQAREAGLLCRELPGGELMVYDTERHQAHSLNRAATLIWQQCDGQTIVGELVTRLRKLELPADEAVIWMALSRLEKHHLLQEQLSAPPVGISRRAVIRKLGLAGGLVALLPLVDSIHSPAAANAVSTTCAQRFQSCSASVPCCEGLVCGNATKTCNVP